VASHANKGEKKLRWSERYARKNEFQGGIGFERTPLASGLKVRSGLRVGRLMRICVGGRGGRS